MKNVIGVVLKKELLDLFRDKKTLILSILIPIILLPIMSFAIGKWRSLIVIRFKTILK